jgi:S-adenosylmethionine hydrolase
MKLESDNLTFPTKTVFPQAATHLERGGTPEVIGRKVVRIREQQLIAPAVDGEARIRGAVIHIDTYGNAVTNIRREVFERMARTRRFNISFGRSTDAIKEIHGTYGDVPPGERVAFFGATGNLEIAVNKGVEGAGGGVDRLFGLRVQDPVLVEFMDR